MYPDLVRSSRFDLHFQQSKFAVSAFNLLGYLPVRDGLTPRSALTRTARGHARATNHIAADSGVDGPFCHLGPAVNQRGVRFLNFAAGKLLCELSVSQIRFGYQNKPAGLFVQAMHNPRPQLSADF